MGETVRMTLAGHVFAVTPTEHYGIHTGRQRFRVECETCGSTEHEATTGPVERIRRHLMWTRAGDAEFLLGAVLNDALRMAQESVAKALAPAAEGGQPTPLWQMVRAASESKFGEPTDTDPTLANVKFGWRSKRVWVRVNNGIAVVTHGHNITGPVVAECTTPDALRAALDWVQRGGGAEIVIDARCDGDVDAALKEAGEMVAWLRGG